MSNEINSMLKRLPDCPFEGCVRKAHGPGQGVHVGERDEQGRVVVWPVEEPVAEWDEDWNAPPLTLHHILRPDGLPLFLRALAKADTVVFDLETMSDRKPNEDWHTHSRIVSAAFSMEPGTVYVLAGSHPAGNWMGDYTSAMHLAAKAMRGKRIAGHNLKYDVRWMQSVTGVDLRPLMWWDTMIAQHVLDENEPKGLKHLGEVHLGVKPWADVDLGRSEEEPWDDLATYNAKDTDATLRLIPIQRALLAEDPSQARLYKLLMMPAAKALMTLERTGMLVDRPALAARQKELTALISEKEEYLWEEHTPPDLKDRYCDPTLRMYAGLDGRVEIAAPKLRPTWSPNGTFFKDFMEANGAPVIQTTKKTGKPSWAEGVMKRVASMGDYPFVDEVLDLRHLTKEQTAFVTPWLEMLSDRDRLHPTFNPANVTTGRLSAQNPNPQQIGRNLKQHFVAPEGWLVVQADYAQIELRIAAEIAQDEAMLSAFRRGDDLHRLMAAQIAEVAPEEVTPEQRQQAKACNFGFLYGMGARKFVDYAFTEYGVTFTQEGAEAVRDLFFRTWAGLAPWHEKQRRLAFSKGYVRSPLGRRRRLPDIYSGDSFLASQAERQAINAPIQSYASDLMLLATIGVVDEVSSEIVRPFCTVHDSLIFYARRGRVKEAIRAVADQMLHPPVTRLFGAPPLSVPLAVDFEIGRAWKDPDSVAVTLDNR